MYRIIILYEEAPDPEGYADHVERFCQPLSTEVEV